MKKHLLGAILAAAASVSMGDVVLPATSTIAEIQAAIDDAQPGDVVTLADGTYALDRTLYVTNGVTLTGSNRDECRLAGDGRTGLAAAVVIDHPSACVKNLTVSNVSVGVANDYSFGGAVRIVRGLLSQSRVTGCTTTYAGNRTAGVSLEGSAANAAAMTHCMVDRNASPGGVGGVRLFEKAGTMANCLVWANSGKTAGGVGVINTTAWQPANIVNCTVAGNSASQQGGGINLSVPSGQLYWQGTSYAPVVNTIIAGNNAPAGADLYFGNDDCRNYTGYNCLCPTETYGANPRTGDPMFLSPESGDFHLQSGSPARNAGDAAKAESVLGHALAGTDDFYGLDRLLEGIVDIGCAEFDSTKPSCSILKSKDPVFTGEKVRLTASVSGFDQATDLVYQWTISRDGVVLLTLYEPSIEVKQTTPGTYDVRLTVTSYQPHRTVEAVPTTFVVLQNTIYVTSSANPGCAYPYAESRTAATNLNEALLAASEGMLVSMDEGTHNVYETVSIPRGVTVRGAGRDKTTIYAAQPFNTVVSINGEGAELRDVTVAHGRMDVTFKYVPSGVAIGSDGGTMADCRVTDCTPGEVGAMDGSVKITGAGALVSRCLIDGNDVLKGGNWANTCAGIYATAGRIENCVITNNVGSMNSTHKGSALCLVGPVTVLNCTVISNRMVSVSSGGAVHAESDKAVVRNCIIDGNLNGDGSETNYWGSGASFSYCLSSDAAPEGSEGCIAARPVFDNRNPLRLAYRTPGRSKGSAVGYEDRLLEATDFCGRPRVKFVSKKGVADIDIGAAESKFISDATLLIFR